MRTLFWSLPNILIVSLQRFHMGNLRKNHSFVDFPIKNCDLTNYERTKELFERLRPQYVIHLAANVGGLFKNMNHKVEMYEVNTLINLNVHL